MSAVSITCQDMDRKPKLSIESLESKPEPSQIEPRTPAANPRTSPQDAKASFSKTDVRFWRERLFKRDGADWYVQIGFAGHQERFPLKTPNREDAAAKSRDIYLSLHSVGWDETRLKFKPWQDKLVRVDSPTVGDYLQLVERHAGIKPTTFTDYTRKFRRLVAGVIGIKGGKAKFDYVSGGAQAWRKKVDVVRLAEITPAAVNVWRKEFVGQWSGNPARFRRAETTVQSIIRNSKSLLSPKVIRSLTDANVAVQLPTPSPFDGVDMGKSIRHRYRSNINAGELFTKATDELSISEPEAFKVFLLAFAVGLRRGEIDVLTWSQFNWSKNQINIEASEHGDTKTEASMASVDVDPEIVAMFRKFKGDEANGFVIGSKVQPKPSASWHHYRCNRVFKALLAWLRAQGVTGHNPIHTLRKEFGSLLCDEHGLFATSMALRHTDIRLTRDHYVDRKGRIHLEIGKLVKGGNQS